MNLEVEWEREQLARRVPPELSPIQQRLSAARLHCERVHGATMLEDYRLDVAGWHNSHHPDCPALYTMETGTKEE